MRVDGRFNIAGFAGGLACMVPTAVDLLTTFDDDALLDDIKAGARGYLLKDVSLEQLTDAIRTVSRGETLLRPAILRSRPSRLDVGLTLQHELQHEQRASLALVRVEVLHYRACRPALRQDDLVFRGPSASICATLALSSLRLTTAVGIATSRTIGFHVRSWRTRRA